MTGRKSIIDMKKKVMYAKGLLTAGTPMIVFDLETTGIKSKTDRILSFSAIKVILENGVGKIQDSVDLFINPGFHIPNEITEITGISDDTVKDCPAEDEAVNTIKNFFGAKPFIAGYNSVSFDEKFINQMYMRTLGMPFKPLFHLDVMMMGKEKVALKSYKLCNLAKELGADIGLTFHHSMDDVIATYRCYDILRTEYECPDEEKELIKVKIKDIRYWEGPRWNLKRIYVSICPPHQKTKVYYDIIRKEWISDDDSIDLDDIRKNILAKYKTDNETGMVSIVKQNKSA